MFEINENTRREAVAEMKSILIECFDESILKNEDALVTQYVGEAFDAAVAIVKKQFGL